MFGIEVASRGVGSTGVVAGLLGVGLLAAVLYSFHARRLRGRCWISGCCG